MQFSYTDSRFLACACKWNHQITKSDFARQICLYKSINGRFPASAHLHGSLTYCALCGKPVSQTRCTSRSGKNNAMRLLFLWSGFSPWTSSLVLICTSPPDLNCFSLFVFPLSCSVFSLYLYLFPFICSDLFCCPAVFTLTFFPCFLSLFFPPSSLPVLSTGLPWRSKINYNLSH